MLLFIKDSNLPRAKFSPGLSAPLLQRTVLSSLGHAPLTYTVHGQRNGKFSHSWEEVFLGGKASSLCRELFYLVVLEELFTRREKRSTEPPPPKDGNCEEGRDGVCGGGAQAVFALLLTASPGTVHTVKTHLQLYLKSIFFP